MLFLTSSYIVLFGLILLPRSSLLIRMCIVLPQIW